MNGVDDRTAAPLREWCTVSIVLAILLLGSAVPAAGDVVTLTAVRDNTLFEDAAGSLSNGEGPVFFAGMNGQNLIRRALVRFDVTGFIPPGVVISSAVLTLNVSNASDESPRIVTIHRALKDWGEGTSAGTGGGGAPATPGDATWLCTFHPEALWTNMGGDFEPIAGASQLLGGVGSYSWSAPPLASDVQAWCGGVVPNYGWVIVGDETAPGTARRFDSHENTVAANRPTLTVTYTVTTGVGDRDGLSGVALGPCWPNPGAGPMRVGISLAGSTQIRLAVYDVRGRHIATVAERTFTAGVHQVVWEGRSLDGRAAGNGVYFLVLFVHGHPVAARRFVRMP